MSLAFQHNQYLLKRQVFALAGKFCQQNFNPFSYQLHVDFSMDINQKLDRRVGLAAGILLAAIEDKQN
jgi:hypothetical protein